MEEKYFVVKIAIDYMTDKGLKTQKEEKLVRGYSVTDVEAKVTKKMEGQNQDWRITSAAESKIDEVFE